MSARLGVAYEKYTCNTERASENLKTCMYKCLNKKNNTISYASYFDLKASIVSENSSSNSKA